MKLQINIDLKTFRFFFICLKAHHLFHIGIPLDILILFLIHFYLKIPREE